VTPVLWGVVVTVLALALSTAGGAVVVRTVLNLASKARDTAEDGAAPRGDARADSDAPAPADVARVPSELETEQEPAILDSAEKVLSGGMWIGILERLAVTGTLLAGYPAGIALVIAVKGLGRYPELKDRPAVSERFVIGTLASLVWSAGLGALARAALERL